MSTRGLLRASEVSMTITRSCTSTCVAARPTPSAAYMVQHVVDERRMRVDLRATGLATVQARVGVAEDVQVAICIQSILPEGFVERATRRSVTGPHT